MMKHNPRHAQLGFTLIEIIASLAMFAVLAGAMVTIFNSSVRLRERADENTNKGLQRDLVLQVLRRDLVNAVAPAAEAEETTEDSSPTGETPSRMIGEFIGEINNPDGSGYPTLEFSTTDGDVSDAAPWVDFRRIQYRLEEPELGTDAIGMDFVRKVTDNLLPDREERFETAYPEWRLLHGVESMTIEYLNLENQIWQDTWSSETDGSPMPTLVRILITFVQPGDRRGADDLLFQPPLTVVAELTTEALEIATEDTTQQGGAS